MQKNRIELLKSFLEEDPTDSFVIFALAKEYEKMDTLKIALDTYIHLKTLDPDYVGLYYHLADLQVKLGQIPDALKTYEEGIAVAKKVADFHALSELHNAKMNIGIE